MILTLYSRKLTFWRLDHEQSCSHNKIVKVSKYAGLLDFFNIMCKSVNVIVILRTGLGRRNDSWMDDAKRKFKGYCDTWNKVGRTEIKENVYLKCFFDFFQEKWPFLWLQLLKLLASVCNCQLKSVLRRFKIGVIWNIEGWSHCWVSKITSFNAAASADLYVIFYVWNW